VLDKAIERRDFLRLSAIAAAGTIVAACTSGGGGGGGGTSGTSSGGTVQVTKNDIVYVKGLTYSGKFKEAPSLAAQVKAGSLPPVEQRVPQHPYVVPHTWVNQGKYGGNMNWVCSDTTDASTLNHIYNAMYGHSPLRWLHDGQQIGPGLAESWSANSDLSTWTLNFRKGLKWSDGQPWTVDDILFWWNDIVGTPALNQTPPQELRSGKGTPVTMNKVDDTTLQLQYDSPTPLAPDYIAMWTKRSIGPRWMDPKHYLSQFHIKYNKSLDPTTWVAAFTDRQNWNLHPDNPTMTGWRAKVYKQGQFASWERNPYYWVIDRWGNQLPYVDTIVMTNYQDSQAMRLAIQQGKADYVGGSQAGLNLSDVASFRSTQSQSNLNLTFWDSGSGTASMYFFNYDHADPKLRALFRNPKFVQAMSLAYNRENARKTIYFNQGEATTGGMSPKAVEFHVGDGPSVYKQIRDTWKGFDAEKAKSLLDSIGVKMPTGGQWRTMPDGSPLTITLDYPANTTDEHKSKNDLLSKDWQAIGINANPNPVVPTAFSQQWAAGALQMTTAWEVGDGPNCLTYSNWLIPQDNARWAPLQGQWFLLQKTNYDAQASVDPWKRTPPNVQPEAGSAVDRIQKLYLTAPTEPDFMKRNNIVWQIMKIHVTDGPFFGGTVANYPQLVLHKNDLKNVPQHNDLTLNGFTNPWTMVSPGVYDPETWFWQNPSQHTTS
jgi:peptide/nickel transport system substrate-binding protein